MDRDGNLRGGKDNRKTWDTYRLLAPLRPPTAQSTDFGPARLRASVRSQGDRERLETKTSRDRRGTARPAGRVSQLTQEEVLGP